MILSYKSFGEGTPLVILHGLFGSSDNWQTFAKSIGDRYQVIAIDLRNHGNSPHEDQFSFKWIDQDLIETLDALHLSGYHLLGHSLGGKAAMVHALHHPARVGRLIVIDIAPKAYPPHHELYFKVMRSMDFDQITNRTEADLWMQKEIQDTSVRQFLLKSLVRNDEGRFKWKFNLEALYRHYDEINITLEGLPSFDHSTVFIKGELSDYIKDEDHALIHHLFTNSKIETIHGAGHWVHADQPERLREVVLSFLQ